MVFFAMKRNAICHCVFSKEKKRTENGDGELETYHKLDPSIGLARSPYLPGSIGV
jgi:hypothetical protein